MRIINALTLNFDLCDEYEARQEVLRAPTISIDDPCLPSMRLIDADALYCELIGDADDFYHAVACASVIPFSALDASAERKYEWALHAWLSRNCNMRKGCASCPVRTACCYRPVTYGLRQDKPN